MPPEFARAADAKHLLFWLPSRDSAKMGGTHMPTISQFYGITIRMYFDDHPPPHFHVYYGNDAAKIDIDTLRVSEGKLRRRTLSLVLEWAVEHRDELNENWNLAEVHGQLKLIAPLE